MIKGNQECSIRGTVETSCLLSELVEFGPHRRRGRSVGRRTETGERRTGHELAEPGAGSAAGAPQPPLHEAQAEGEESEDVRSVDGCCRGLL